MNQTVRVQGRTDAKGAGCHRRRWSLAARFVRGARRYRHRAQGKWSVKNMTSRQGRGRRQRSSWARSAAIIWPTGWLAPGSSQTGCDRRHLPESSTTSTVPVDLGGRPPRSRCRRAGWSRSGPGGDDEATGNNAARVCPRPALGPESGMIHRSEANDFDLRISTPGVRLRTGDQPGQGRMDRHAGDGRNPGPAALQHVRRNRDLQDRVLGSGCDQIVLRLLRGIQVDDLGSVNA